MSDAEARRLAREAAEAPDDLARWDRLEAESARRGAREDSPPRVALYRGLAGAFSSLLDRALAPKALAIVDQLRGQDLGFEPSVEWALEEMRFIYREMVKPWHRPWDLAESPLARVETRQDGVRIMIDPWERSERLRRSWTEVRLDCAEGNGRRDQEARTRGEG